MPDTPPLACGTDPQHRPDLPRRRYRHAGPRVYVRLPLQRSLTGFGGTPMLASAPASKVLDRTMTIRFDANVAPNLPWRFTPETPSIKAKIGETQGIKYKIQNLGDAPATATYNVLSELAGIQFMKLECFCFKENTLQTGETMEATIAFLIDPVVADDLHLHVRAWGNKRGV